MRVLGGASLLVLLGLTGFAQAQQVPHQPAHLVLINGRVWTVDEARPEAEAVAIRGNRIIKVGTNAEVRKLIGENFTQVLNLEGRLVLPGFIISMAAIKES